MSRSKVAVIIDPNLLKEVDRLVHAHVFEKRRQVFQRAIAEKLGRVNRSRLAKECAKLDPSFEQALAEEGISAEAAEGAAYQEATFPGPI